MIFKYSDDSSLHFWLQPRCENGPLDGLWEFPGGKIEEGEEPKVALVREIFEECQVDISNQRIHQFGIYPFDYTDRKVVLFSYLIDGNSLDPVGGEWVEVNMVEGKLKDGRGTLEANDQILGDFCQYWLDNSSKMLNQVDW